MCNTSNWKTIICGFKINRKYSYFKIGDYVKDESFLKSSSRRMCSLGYKLRVRWCFAGFGEAISEASSLHQRRLAVAHGTQLVALLWGPHPDDEVPALAMRDGQCAVHVLAPVEEAFGDPVFSLCEPGLTNWILQDVLKKIRFRKLFGSI